MKDELLVAFSQSFLLEIPDQVRAYFFGKISLQVFETQPQS